MGFRVLVLFSVLALALSGCGGGGGDDDTQIDPNTSLIGTWQPISATVDGEAVKVSEVMPDTDIAATRWVMVFNQNGTCTFTGYGPTGSLIESISGTWSSDNQIAPVTIDGETTEIHWSDQGGNLMTAQYTIDVDDSAVDVEAKWVRIIPEPTGHLIEMVELWRAAEVFVNGVAVPLADFFGWATGSNLQTIEMQSDGDAVLTEWSGSTPIETRSLSWATTDLVIRLTDGGKVLWGYYEYPMLRFTVLDPETGDTIKMNWINWGD